MKPNTEIDPVYLKQIEAARQAVYKAGASLVARHKANFGSRPHDLARALRRYNKRVDEHDIIIDGVCDVTFEDFYDQSPEWQLSAEGRAFADWEQDLERAKIGEINPADVRKKHLPIVCGA